jgi:hypothetical protein
VTGVASLLRDFNRSGAIKGVRWQLTTVNLQLVVAAMKTPRAADLAKRRRRLDY